MPTNPFTENKYYIYISTKASGNTCDNTVHKSKVVAKDRGLSSTGYTIKTKNGNIDDKLFNLLEVESYIRELLESFSNDWYLYNICTAYKLTTTTKTDKYNKCNTIFTGEGTDSNPLVYKLNDKKQLCQQLNDINSLLIDYNGFIKNIDTTGYTYDYGSIKNKYNNMIKTRDELNKKVNDLYSEKGSRLENSKLYLDSTVYTSVLWTILATTIIFYIFKKM
jgi:hypothetical protein